MCVGRRGNGQLVYRGHAMAAARVRTVLFFDHPLAVGAAAELARTAAGVGLPVQVTVRPRADATAAELADARYLVSFGPPDPALERAEVWPTDAARVSAEVSDLVARLFTGAARGTLPPPVPITTPKPVKPPKPTPPPTVKVSRETKGRRGKGVTLVSELPAKLGAQGLGDLAAVLKSRCGTGGTVRDGVIEIQGDMRERVAAELEKLGYKVKHAGG